MFIFFIQRTVSAAFRHVPICCFEPLPKGTSVVLNTITTEAVTQTASDYELKIVITDTPSIQFWIRGSMYYEETVNLPNFNLGMYPFFGVGNSSTTAWVAPKMFNVIADRY